MRRILPLITGWGRITDQIEKRKLVIFCAVEFEAKAVRRALGDRDSVDLYTIGIRGGRMPAELGPVQGIVMAGLAGGLDPELKVGDVVVDSESDPRIAQELPYRKVRMHTARELVGTPEERERLFREIGAGVVEMENEGVRELARRLGVPYVGIRAISDAASETLSPALVRVVDDVGRVKVGALVGELVRRPGMVGELNRLRKQSGLAVANLAQAVRSVVEKLPS